ncbi:alpha/beta hydrolase [Rhodococcus triatomae]|uniref:Pimeloyl-ACP methyl ester carboxylesterase n=1 Tax=Rhodococcus triatomae TaxID=300028 RepID=A0A1G8RP00_9NOCA|nr:alpha/beta hydrolase [Rhodococcus triatomae]QNG19891.1 alpha/beta hydrolase [Rhodococcus triatomae]QNG24194.1 alpha/beta hydrolase [Rhodococcus triatomae]SDJ18623.1 Pimeloyl-ACP methyl ester carboxylesterase [Rhodococcus triatomae]
MTSSSRTRLLAFGALGAGVVAAGLYARRRRAGRAASAAPAPRNPLLGEPTTRPEIIDVVTDDGAVLHARAYGPADAPPIVLVHGWACSIEYWYPQINALAGDYRVIAYDQRGHGRSTAGTRVFDPDVLADDLEAVLEATVVGDHKAEIVGHSMGGMSIIAWAERHSDKVDRFASAVLLASTATDSLVAESTVIPLPPRFPKVPLPVGRAIIGASLPIVSTPMTAKAIQYVTMSPRATREEVEFCGKIVSGCQPRTRGGWGIALSNLDIRRGLENLTVPTTVLVGTVDRLTPQSHARRLARTLDQADNLQRLIVLPGVGHMSSVEDPESVNREIVRLRAL